MKRNWNMATAALAITAATGLAGGAQAMTLVDFTDRGIWTGQDGGATDMATYGSRTVSLSSNPADRLDFTEDFDGPLTAGRGEFCESKSGPLACDSDGVGVIDDEISDVDNTATPPEQSITVDFDKAVRVLSFHFLDLFFEPGEPSADQERARVYFNGDTSTELSFVAQDEFANDGGYGFFANPFGGASITSLTFFADVGNDGQGNPDYALAGIEIQPVPLPAAGWLLLAGLGGLGVLRRFRKA